MANDYTTPAEAFEDMSEGNYTAAGYPQMAGFITVASRLIDAEVGRWAGFFYPTTDTVTYYYDGSGENEQPIDEFVSISAVSVSEDGSSDYTSWTLNTDYLTKPYNATNKGKPINKLVLKSYNGTKGAWYDNQKAVQVQGIAGYSTTPPDLIVQACKAQSVRWFLRAKNGWQDTGGNDEIGQNRIKGMVELDPDIRAMLWGIKNELADE